MELDEIRQCDFCGHPVAGNTRERKELQFQRIVVERHLLDVTSINQRMGLTMMLGGNEAIAAAMAPSSRVSICYSRRELMICNPCMYDRLGGLLELGDAGREMKPDKEAE